MAAVRDSASPTDPAPLPASVDVGRLRRAALKLGAAVVVVVILVTLLPGLGELRERFAHASAGWIVVGCALEVLSCLAYVLAFRRVFCIRMSRSTSYKIAMSELGADSLLPVGGAGGLALGAWALRRGGMPTKEIADKTVAFFLLTSVPNVAGLALLGIGLAVHVLPGKSSIALTVIPAVVAIGGVVVTLLLGRLSRRLATRSEGGRPARLAPALRATADGIDEAVRLLRTGDPWLLSGVIGYMVFDIMVLWVSFRAIGSTPEFATISIAYVIGQLGNLIPIPGGIGGVELGLIGALVLYGLPAVTSTAAVLLYRVIELWIPGLLGLVAFVQLRSLLRRETEAIDMCQPGEIVEVIGVGSVTKPIA